MELEQAGATAGAQEWNTLRVQEPVHQLLVGDVERTGCLIEERVARTVEQEAREGEPLLLAR